MNVQWPTAHLPSNLTAFGFNGLNEISVDLEIFSRIVTLFVVKIASDAGQALKSGVLVMHGPKDQKLNYHNQGRQF